MSADFDWSPIDELIYLGAHLTAIKGYREGTGAGLREAIDAVYVRLAALRAAYPERFPPPERPRDSARRVLSGLAGPVLAIEALWDGESSVELVAITNGASLVHPSFTDVFLCRVTGADVGDRSMWEVATRIQRELAEGVKADVHEAPRSPDDEAPRWWETIDGAP